RAPAEDRFSGRRQDRRDRRASRPFQPEPGNFGLRSRSRRARRRVAAEGGCTIRTKARIAPRRTAVAAAPEPAMTKLAIFDCDGTLVDSGATIYGALRETFELHGIALPPPRESRKVIGLSLTEAMAALVPG